MSVTVSDMAAEPIDLLHLGSEKTIGATSSRPTRARRRTTAGRRRASSSSSAGLQEHGLELAEIRHLLLSHIHLDHAGAAGVLVRRHLP